MTEAAASPLQAAGFRWLLLYRILTLLSYQVVAVTERVVLAAFGVKAER